MQPPFEPIAPTRYYDYDGPPLPEYPPPPPPPIPRSARGEHGHRSVLAFCELNEFLLLDILKLLLVNSMIGQGMITFVGLQTSHNDETNRGAESDVSENVVEERG